MGNYLLIPVKHKPHF